MGSRIPDPSIPSLALGFVLSYSTTNSKEIRRIRVESLQ